VAQILGTTFPGDSYIQACVSTKIGGLGVRRVSDHANGAFSASWYESLRTSMEKWDALPSCGVEGLIARASARDAQRLRRNDVSHANAWISALPSATDGKDTVMQPRVYLTAVRRLLGLPVSSAPAPCPSASKPWIFMAITPYAAESQAT